jgi:hypothetical protein
LTIELSTCDLHPCSYDGCRTNVCYDCQSKRNFLTE